MSNVGGYSSTDGVGRRRSLLGYLEKVAKGN